MTDYKLMPKQITKEMADAFWEEYSKDRADDLLMRCYKALYVTAPAPQPAEQPVSWIRISGDRVILSRCNWIYPASTEDSAGPRDEQRFTAVGRRDGDIVLLAPEGSLDREDMETMLAWPSASKSVEQKPDATQLVEALARCRHQASYSIGEEDALRIQLGKVRDIVNETLSALPTAKETSHDNQ